MNTRHVVCSIALLFLCSMLFGEDGAPAKIKAEAEVSATTKPIKLTLRLYKTKIEVGESLWYQLEIANVGDRPITIADDFLDDPWSLEDNLFAKHGIFFLIKDSKGKVLNARPYRGRGSDQIGFDKTVPMDPAKQKIIRAKIEGWKKEGLSGREIDKKLLEYDQAHPSVHRPTTIVLKAQEKWDTKPWAEAEKSSKDMLPSPLAGGFSQLAQYHLGDPGKYTVVVVYDQSLSAEAQTLSEKLKLQHQEGNVSVTTPPAEVVVVR